MDLNIRLDIVSLSSFYPATPRLRFWSIDNFLTIIPLNQNTITRRANIFMVSGSLLGRPLQRFGRVLVVLAPSVTLLELCVGLAQRLLELLGSRKV